MTGTRFTFQRMKILEYLKGIRHHPTAEQIYNEVKKQIPSITLATVYRNLNLLAREGKIKRLEINHEYRFDAHIGCHQHFVCENTGKVYDVEDKEITDYILKRLNKENFDPKSVEIIIRGICKKPQEAN